MFGNIQFMIRVDYLNSRGEEHHLHVFGSEAPETAEEQQQRFEALRLQSQALGRTVLQVQRLELAGAALPLDAPRTKLKLVA